MKDLLEIDRQRAVVVIGQHQVSHMRPPTPADFGLRDLRPQLFRFDLDVSEELVGFAIEEVDYRQWRTALLAAAAVSRDNALSVFAGLFPEDSDSREPKFDCSATAAAVEPFGLQCPPADAALFTVHLRFLQACGFLSLPDEVAA